MFWVFYWVAWGLKLDPNPVCIGWSSLFLNFCIFLSSLDAVSLISLIPLSSELSGCFICFLGESANGSPHQEGYILGSRFDCFYFLSSINDSLWDCLSLFVLGAIFYCLGSGAFFWAILGSLSCAGTLELLWIAVGFSACLKDPFWVYLGCVTFFLVYFSSLFFWIWISSFLTTISSISLTNNPVILA